MQRLLSCLILGIFLFATASAQDQAADMSAQNATSHRASGGQALTGPSEDAPGQIIAEFLRGAGRSNLTVGSLVLVSEYTAGGLTHVRMEQQFGGLAVYGAYVKASLNGQGELLSVVEMLAPAVNVGNANVDEQGALATVVGQLYPSARPSFGQGVRDGNKTSFPQNGFFHQDPTVTRVIAALAGGRLQEAFLVETWTEESNLLHHTLVSGNGRILSSELRTNLDSYHIFPDHPGNSGQTTVAGPGASNAESPSGWLNAGNHQTVDISGNNVHAYLDTDANNSPDGGGSTITDGNFITAANLGQEPETATNKAVAVQNLFYFNNVIHDELYRHGFVEGAGNFQENNFGNGGAGSDSVNAEAQDGSGTNNANFATPSDGSNPRMQMYVWTLTSPKRDGDLDSDIIYHEYGHGLTWRMIGGMSGPMSGAIGEGMSDVLSIVMNNNDIVGEYSYNNTTNGIRSRFYTGYETYRTYGDFTGSSVHRDGEIYAAAIWKLWGLYQNAGHSRDDLLDDLVMGMNSTPSGPAMEDMRDGILTMAVLNGRECLVWEAFAAFGIGDGARGQVKGGGPFGGGKVSITESFDMPSTCSGQPDPILITTTSLPDATEGQAYSQQIDTSGGSGAQVWGLSGAPTWLGIDSSGLLSGTPTTTGPFSFTVDVSDDTGTDSQGLTLNVNSAPSGGTPDAPSNLSGSAKRRFIMLTWNDNSNNETHFEILRCTGTCAPTNSLGTAAAGSTNYKDSTAADGQTYTYGVIAVNGAGPSALSNLFTITK